MKSSALRAVVVLIPVVLVVGLVTGLMIRPTVDRLLLGHVAESGEHADEEQAEEEGEHVALTRQAYQNLGLTVGRVELSDYTHALRMPGEIIESPGMSMQTVAAPVSGRVARLFTYPGVSVTQGYPLCELEIVDDQLAEAQLRLLELLTKQEIAEAELERLTPLASTGSVAGSKRLEWEYQKKELDSSLSRTRQELAMRGLSEEQIGQIHQTRRAITTLTVATPRPVAEGLREGSGSPVRLSTWLTETPDQTDLTVEELLVEAGQNVARGDPICTLAAHGLLSVEGYSFENEIELVSSAASEEKPVTVEIGMGDRVTRRPGLTVQYVDGIVDQSTQTYRFYVPLPNEVVAESTDPLGRRFRTWRYKVGQRVHVLVPDRELQGQIVVPRDAVVRDGPNAYVFRECDEHEEEDEGLEDPEDHEDHEGHDHGEEETFIELVPVPVTVVCQDRMQAVIAPGEELVVGDHIATNSGYQLLLALKSQQEGGGHSGHQH